MKSLKTYMILGAVFVSILGTIFHFVYDWTGNNTIISIFVPVNESIWEHTKLIFFPMLLYSIYLNKKITAKYPYINSAMILGELSGVLSIIVLYYTYSGIIGYNIAFADISIFYISVVIAFYIAYKTVNCCKAYTILWILQILIFLLYVIFTFNPPSIALFTQ